MTAHALDQQIGAAQARLAVLRARTGPEAPGLASAEALDDLERALEELCETAETLQAQNDALQVGRAEVLRERQRYRDLFEAAPEPYLVTDDRGSIQQVSAAAARLLGVEVSFLKGAPLLGCVHPEDSAVCLQMLAELRGGAEVHAQRIRVQTQAGGALTTEISATGRVDQGGEGVEFRWLLRDVSTYREAEERLRRGAERAEALVRAAARLNAQLDLDAVLYIVAEEAARALHMPAALVTLYDAGRAAFTLAASYGLPPEFAAQYRPPVPPLTPHPASAVERVVVLGDAQGLSDLPNQALLGQLNLCTAIGVHLTRREELVGMLTLFSAGEPRDLGEDEHGLLAGLADEAGQAIANARLHAQVDQQRATLRALAARLAETEQSERKRLARELHDQVAQNLSAIGVDLHIVRGLLTGGGANGVREHLASQRLASERLDEALALVDETAAQVRSLMAELRPGVLDDYGLLAALRWYGARFGARTGIAVTVQGGEASPRLATTVENALFHIAQEALANVAKHAHATQVRVTQEVLPTRVRLTIADNGIGLAAAQQSQRNPEPGWGLLTMAERAESVDGACRVEAGPSDGTQVVVEAPR